MIPDRQPTTSRAVIPGGGRAPSLRLVLACAFALAAAACSDTLVDHDGDRFYAGQICQGTPTSCGSGSACVDCTTSYTPPGDAHAICGAGSTCDFECNEGWLRCGTGCCRTLAVAAGAAHTCAIVGQLGDPSGQLKCWGANERGQLGVGDTQDRLIPADVVGMNTGVTLVAAGSKHTCAVKAGALYCWGANADPDLDGRLGVTTSASQYEYPQSVNLSNVTALAPGERHTCALAAGNVYCWGSNGRGQLGSGAIGGARTTPPSTPTLSGALAVASGRAHACALVAGAVRCWGANDWGQLGNGAALPGADDQPSPVAAGTLAAVTALAAGARHSCAVDASGPDPLLWCWGENTDGQLGRGSVGGAFSTPDVASDIQSLRPVAAAAGRAHTCAFRDAEVTAKCVGSNASGQLGQLGAVGKGDAQIGQAVGAIAAGDDHACALGAADGSLFCWGANGRGQVGTGSAAGGVFTPAAVSGR